MQVISESPNGNRRMVVIHEGVGRHRRSITRHEVHEGAAWVYQPNTVTSPWPAGKNFLRREDG